MKIQFHGGQTFSLLGNETKIVLDPIEILPEGNFNFAVFSEPKQNDTVTTKKILSLPGEYEIAGVLVTAFFSDKNSNNVAYKIIMDDISLVYFGNLDSIPDTKFFEKLGENFDLVVLNLNEKFNGKDAKEMIEILDPRMVILGGSTEFFPKMMEIMGAKTASENPLKISRTNMAEDKTEILILSN